MQCCVANTGVSSIETDFGGNDLFLCLGSNGSLIACGLEDKKWTLRRYGGEEVFPSVELQFKPTGMTTVNLGGKPCLVLANE